MLRKYHRIVSLIVALPFALILITGLVLQLRQQFEGIQPKAVKMERLEGVSLLSMEQILSKVNSKDVDQIIFRPGKFHLALRLKNGDEIQMHPQTGEILKKAHRYTNILIELHQGSLMGSWGQYAIILPAGLGVFFLLFSGVLIYPWRRFKRG